MKLVMLANDAIYIGIIGQGPDGEAISWRSLTSMHRYIRLNYRWNFIFGLDNATHVTKPWEEL